MELKRTGIDWHIATPNMNIFFLFFSDDEIPSDTDEEVEEDEGQTPKRKKLKVEEYETEIGDRHETFRGFCHRTLNMWNEKTRLASGRTGTGSKSGFGAFDQSILKQIEGILADKQRLVNRTRIKRSTYRVLGCLPKSQDTVKISEEEETLKVTNHTNYSNFILPNAFLSRIRRRMTQLQ